MIQIKNNHLTIINNIINKYPYDFYAFGSRTKGFARDYSDLDLCYKEYIPIITIGMIQEDFENSNLPFKVDLVNWNWISKDFQKLIIKDLKSMKKIPIEKNLH
ncbi:MAG: hypothetical protein AD073_000253 [Mycoplasmataceae bacterium]|nr:MAG: hypothetical protein AD073_000253 [Mycoplasmataceae bacterium]